MVKMLSYSRYCGEHFLQYRACVQAVTFQKSEEERRCGWCFGVGRNDGNCGWSGVRWKRQGILQLGSTAAGRLYDFHDQETCLCRPGEEHPRYSGPHVSAFPRRPCFSAVAWVVSRVEGMDRNGWRRTPARIHVPGGENLRPTPLTQDNFYHWRFSQRLGPKRLSPSMYVPGHCQ